jgi:hypothetical protein
MTGGRVARAARYVSDPWHLGDGLADVDLTALLRSPPNGKSARCRGASAIAVRHREATENVHRRFAKKPRIDNWINIGLWSWSGLCDIWAATTAYWNGSAGAAGRRRSVDGFHTRVSMRWYLPRLSHPSTAVGCRSGAWKVGHEGTFLARCRVWLRGFGQVGGRLVKRLLAAEADWSARPDWVPRSDLIASACSTG